MQDHESVATPTKQAIPAAVHPDGQSAWSVMTLSGQTTAAAVDGERGTVVGDMYLNTVCVAARTSKGEATAEARKVDAMTAVFKVSLENMIDLQEASERSPNDGV